MIIIFPAVVAARSTFCAWDMGRAARFSATSFTVVKTWSTNTTIRITRTIQRNIS